MSRLVGLETEYAIRFSPPSGGRGVHPGNDTIYDALKVAIGQVVASRPGERAIARKQIFVENGGSFYYELLPYAPSDGLIEGSTPECRGPSDLLLYQRAQEALLLDAIPIAQRILNSHGFEGEIGLLKNCKDAEGHVYGAQENYTAEVARGFPLFLLRAGIVTLLPVTACTVVLVWAAAMALALIAVAVYVARTLGAALIPGSRKREPLLNLIRESERAALASVLGKISYALEYVLCMPVLGPFALLLRWFGFRRVRQAILPFLVSRPIVSGAGTLEPDHSFGLSEKGPAIRCQIRRTVSPNDRPICDVGNLMKDMMSPLGLRIRPLLRLFRRHQRLQLGLSDSNAAQIAEYLKVGTTSLVLDLAEAGMLPDAPRLRDPIRALHSFASDPTLKKTAQLAGSTEEMTALEIQRFYLTRAQAAVSQVVSLEAREILRLWAEVLDALEKDPASLIGRIDWVTKRYLLETSGAGATWAAQKKIDLRYHELGVGYLAQMEQQGAAPMLVRQDEVQRAKRSPPEKSPARARGLLVRKLAASDRPVSVSWDTVVIGGRILGRVIRLDEHRR